MAMIINLKPERPTEGPASPTSDGSKKKDSSKDREKIVKIATLRHFDKPEPSQAKKLNSRKLSLSNQIGQLAKLFRKWTTKTYLK